MFCDQCGAELHEGAQFCTKCGNILIDENDTPAAAENNEYTQMLFTPSEAPRAPRGAQPPVEPPKKGKKTKAKKNKKAPAQKPMQYQAAPPKKASAGKTLLIVLLVILLAGCGAFAAWWFLTHTEPQKAEETPVVQTEEEQLASLCVQALNANDPSMLKTRWVDDAFYTVVTRSNFDDIWNYWEIWNNTANPGAALSLDDYVQRYTKELASVGFNYCAGTPLTVNAFSMAVTYRFPPARETPLDEKTMTAAKELSFWGIVGVGKNMIYSIDAPQTIEVNGQRFVIEDLCTVTVGDPAEVKIAMVKRSGVWSVVSIYPVGLSNYETSTAPQLPETQEDATTTPTGTTDPTSLTSQPETTTTTAPTSQIETTTAPDNGTTTTKTTTETSAENSTTTTRNSSFAVTTPTFTTSPTTN